MANTSLVSILEQTGLNDKEARIYLSCMELGTGTVQEIASHAGVKRTSVYNVLEDLKKKGFISQIRRFNKILLVAEDPHALLQKADTQKKKLESAFPEFLAIYNQSAQKPKVLFYEGIEGIKKVYEDTLSAEGEIYEISDYERMFAAVDSEWMWQYPRKRSEKGIQAYSIAKDGARARQVKTKDVEHLRETKLVKDVLFETEINIYGNKVALLSFRRPYAAVIIEDIAIAQTLKSMWQLIWKSLT